MNLDTYRTTENGLHIWIKPVQPEDALHFVSIFEHMGSDSRYFRFNQALANPDATMVLATAQELARLAPPVGEAWLAFTEIAGEGLIPIGGARYVRTANQEAEVSVAVRDDYQRQGVGSMLMMVTFQAAQEAGMQRITAAIRYDNLPVRALLKKLPWEVTWEHDGPYATITVNLSRMRPPSNN